jgi:hypothetical protein
LERAVALAALFVSGQAHAAFAASSTRPPPAVRITWRCAKALTNFEGDEQLQQHQSFFD